MSFPNKHSLAWTALLVVLPLVARAADNERPKFEFRRIENVVQADVFLASPDGLLNVLVPADGAKLQLVNAETREYVGPPLLKDSADAKVYCWTFSRDGKLLAVGTGDHGAPKETFNIGSIVVFDVASRKQVADFDRKHGVKLGTVRSLMFQNDDRVVGYIAELYAIDGK